MVLLQAVAFSRVLENEMRSIEAKKIKSLHDNESVPKWLFTIKNFNTNDSMKKLNSEWQACYTLQQHPPLMLPFPMHGLICWVLHMLVGWDAQQVSTGRTALNRDAVPKRTAADFKKTSPRTLWQVTTYIRDRSPSPRAQLSLGTLFSVSQPSQAYPCDRHIPKKRYKYTQGDNCSSHKNIQAPYLPHNHMSDKCSMKTVYFEHKAHRGQLRWPILLPHFPCTGMHSHSS